MSDARIEEIQRFNPQWWPPNEPIERCTKLDFEKKQLINVPEGISSLSNLVWLRLNENQIIQIPEWISILTRLEILVLFNNQITSVPNGISRLTNLRLLRVESNKITTIPDGISCLIGLNALQLESNQITSVPNGISRLTNLTLLRVDGNKITTIPDGISCLTGLETFWLNGNPIQELPPGISCLLKLKTLLIISSDGVISVKRAPKGISDLPCWNDTVAWPGQIQNGQALRKLTLYDPVTFSTPSILSPRQHASTPTSRLDAGKFADILSLDFKKKENVLGSGGFGIVFKVKLNAGTFAIKLIANAALLKDADSEKEGEMMLKLKHPNILALHDFGYRGDDLLFVMELADGGDLCSFIKKNKALNQDVTMKYGLHIIQGLAYLHTCTPAIQHRDLKTENVLLVQGVAKLSDFGLSKSGASVNSVSRMKGTVKWSPPEVFDFGKSVGLPSDVYSYGVVLWSMITGEYPYQDLKDADVGVRVMSGSFLPLPSTCPANLAALIHRCWEKDYEKRIKAIDVEKLLKDIISNPAAPPTPRKKSVKDMNTAELVKYLEGKNALRQFINSIRDNEVTGEDFLDFNEDALISAPFDLPKFQAKVILRFIEEAKRT